MRICIVIDSIKYSGAAKIVTWLSNNLIKSYEIDVITHSKQKDFYKFSNSVNRLNYFPKRNKLFSGIAYIRFLVDNINKRKYDLLISFLPIESLYGILAAKITNKKIIICERSDPYNEKTFLANIGRFFYRFADGAVFQTIGARDYFSRKIREKSEIIENPVNNINTREYIPYNQRENSICAVSRIDVHQKRLDVLVKAFNEIHKECSNVILNIFGDGPDKALIEKMINEYNLQDYVIFHGKVENITTVIKNSKLYLLTSDFEGIPNSMIEALSVGIPCISTDCSPGGARVLIQNNLNGFIVNREDYEGISKKAIYILKNMEKAERMSKYAYESINKFDENIIYDKWETFIDKIVKEGI